MVSRRKIRVGVLGCGVVGQALLRALARRPIPDVIVTSVVVSNAARLRPSLPDGYRDLLTADWDTIARPASGVDVIVEAVGTPRGATLAQLAAFLHQRIADGTSIVTANKRLLAEHWDEVATFAGAERVSLGFEACVGGGVPMVEPLRARQQLGEVKALVGILNATSNFVITAMANGQPIDRAIGKATQRGLCEGDAADDLDGLDAVWKLCILVSLAFGRAVRPDEVTVREGIREIGHDVFRFCRQFGYRVRPIAVAVRRGPELELGVYPALLAKDHPLARIRGENNALLINGRYSGWHVLSGRGAGPGPTASAMYNDLTRVVQNIRLGTYDAPLLPRRSARVREADALERRGYFHAVAPDQPGNLRQIADILGDLGINIRQFDQIDERGPGTRMPLMLSTDSTPFGTTKAALRAAAQLPDFSEVRYLRIEDVVPFR